MPSIAARPEIVAAHLPPLPGDPARSRLVLAGYAQPWPGGLSITEDASGAFLGELSRRGLVGRLATALAPGPLGVWERSAGVEVEFFAGHPAAVEKLAVLAGSNRMAVRSDEGGWEVLGFAEAELLAPGRYRLSFLLRGLEGSGPAMGAAGAGSPVLLLDERSLTLPVEPHWLRETRNLRLFAGPADLEGTALEITSETGPVLPLPPVHLRARRGEDGDVLISFIRCSRADGDGWGVIEAPLDFVPERYRLTLFDGEETLRSVELDGPAWTYTAAEQLADFGALPAGFAFTVAQISPVLGAGHQARGEFHDQPV